MADRLLLETGDVLLLESGDALLLESSGAATSILRHIIGHEEFTMRAIKKGATDQSVVIRIVDSADGTPETGVEHNTSGIDLWYRREGATKTSITEAALSALNDAHSDGGIEHIGDGYYRLDLPDAAFAAGANGVMVGGTVTGMVVIGCYVPLVDFDPQDTVRLGLTALPNAAADAAGGLPISDAGGLDLDAQLVTKINDILTDTGTTLQAELDGIQADTEDIQARLPAALTAGGKIPASMDEILGVAQSATDLKDFADDGYDPATNKVQGVVLTDTATTLTNAPSDSSGVTTLLSRLSALRAGYLDNLSAGAVATAAKLLSYFQSALRKDVTVDADIGGNYDDATDSQEAIRDRGDAAWTTATGFSTHSAADVWAVGTRTLTSISGLGIALATKLTKYVQLLARKDSAIATDNATELTEINADGGSGSGAYANTTDAQEAMRDNMGTAQTGDSYARLGAPVGASISADIADVEGKVDDLEGRLTATRAGYLDNLASAPPTAGAIADQVWEEAIADHSGTAGSTAEQLAAAGAAGDPWATALPGSYTSGQAGKILGDNLNATVGSRASQTSVDDLPTNAELATALDGVPADVLAAAASTPIAANIKEVNDVEIQGDGSLTPWGPA